MGGVTMTEEWRPVPGHPRYELSNLGRLRGPRSHVSPRLRHSHRPASAMYPVPVGNSKCVALMIRNAMRDIWGISFEPTEAWIEQIRAEVVQMRAGKRAAVRAAQVAEREEKARPTEPKRLCKDCGATLSHGYWWRCPACWDELRKSEF